MAILDFLYQKDPLVLHFNHGTEHGAEAEAFVRKYCFNKGLRLTVGHIDRDKKPDESPEEYWRNCRYKFFRENNLKNPVITCHTLDDQVEQWLFTSLHGKPRLIAYMNPLVLRTFLVKRKDAIFFCREIW
jgi:tRNA(Ile)-lysidine synthase TilS/MesJ